MFGYVIIDKPNILFKDYAVYRSHYCGICKSIGKQSGFLSRFLLNYDIVLLSLLAHNYEKKEPCFLEGRCVAHPVGNKIPYIKDSAILRKIADINTVLGYYKVCDDVIDEGKRRMMKLAMKARFKKAAKRIPAFAKAIESGYNTLRESEKERNPAEVLSAHFGNMLKACADCLTDSADDLLRGLLYELGRWIYIIDAYDDLKKDTEEKKFNPFSGKTYEEAESISRNLLYNSIETIIMCYNKMVITVSEGALSNVIYLGLKARTESILINKGNKSRKIKI